ncbi:MAG: restriction endonuclease [Rhodospirillales bacterium]|nr:restriction endonuclease [Rhodospirillales bacterium]
MILDYSGFVELLENDEAGIYQAQPTIRDIKRNAERLSAGLMIPKPGDVGYYADDVFHCLRQYHLLRSDTMNAACGSKEDKCSHCGGTIRNTKETLLENGRERSTDICATCGWWYCREYLPPVGEGTGFDRSFEVRRASVLREFTIGDIDIPIETLRAHLNKHQEDLWRVNPRVMERLVADIFSDFFECDVVHVGGPKDGGIDAIVLDGNEQRVIQVKRREDSAHIESVREIREFLGAMVLRGSSQGVFATTGRDFSGDAKRAAEMAELYGVVDKLELVNSQKIIDVLRLTERRNVPPYKASELATDCQPFDMEGRKSQVRKLFSHVKGISGESDPYEEHILCPGWINPK